MLHMNHSKVFTLVQLSPTPLPLPYLPQPPGYDVCNTGIGFHSESDNL